MYATLMYESKSGNDGLNDLNQQLVQDFCHQEQYCNIFRRNHLHTVVLFACDVDSHRLPAFQINFNVEAFQLITCAKNIISKLQNMHLERSWKGTWSMMEPPKSWSHINHVDGWILYPDWFPQLFGQLESSQADFFLVNSPFENDLKKIPIHPFQHQTFS